ncbi:BglG family transcription antiterminator [Maledivibacter halophilus]|uniref:Transcriptional antiterminator n=1 Tax=Maledivibacter halophilus TaxID=36842 RepID=A0A1T5MMD7_9FIRM|nr:PRD domain-containing protein [Maledivibacter halophilus]SKC89407.1 Transcriptional antiterminator [Maledivibacter halophilus]
MDKYDLTRRQIIIINSLYKKGTLTSLELSLILNVSVRTIKYEIKGIRGKFRKELLEIVSSSRKGYRIIIRDKDFLNYLEELNSSNKIKFMDKLHKNNYERVFYILRKILTEDDYLKLEDLSKELYVSISTLDQDIKEVKRLLNKYELKIISKPYYGITVMGPELNKRLCISEYIFHNEMMFINQYMNRDMEDLELSVEKIQKIENTVREVSLKSNILISDFSIKNISIHIFIASIRNRKGHEIEVSKDVEQRISKKPLYRILTIYIKELEELLESKFSRKEIAYIYMNIDSKRIVSKEEEITNYIDVEIVLDEVFKEIYNNFDIDISRDKTLRKYLKLHIPQMIKRIRNNLIVRNPVIHENLRKYLYATKVTVSAVDVIENYYKVSIPLDEFGYLLFYFNMALFNLKKKKPFKIGFISSRGRAESIMYQNELRENFNFNETSIITFNTVKEAEEKSSEIDVLVSTSNIQSELFKHKVSIEEGAYIEKVQEYLRRRELYSLDIDKYFCKDYLITGIKGNSRKEILKQIYTKLIELKVAKRKELSKMPFVSHEIGNRVVNLQDLYKVCHKEVCLIVVLEKPILWEKSIVEVFFLIKTKKDGDKDLFILCDLFSKFASDKEKIKDLIDKKDYESFMKDILEY